MKIITAEIERLFNRYPLYSQDGKGDSARVLLKVFNPYGAGSWYVLEAGEKQPNGDRELYGYVTGLGANEYGYFMLSDLVNTRVRVFGMRMPLERDRYFKGTMRDARKDAGEEVA